MVSVGLPEMRRRDAELQRSHGIFTLRVSPQRDSEGLYWGLGAK